MEVLALQSQILTLKLYQWKQLKLVRISQGQIMQLILNSQLWIRSILLKSGHWCCHDTQITYQSTEKVILSFLTSKGHTGLPVWYEKFLLLMLHTSQRKVYCVYFRFAHKHNCSLFQREVMKHFVLKASINLRSVLRSFTPMKPQRHTSKVGWTSDCLLIPLQRSRSPVSWTPKDQAAQHECLLKKSEAMQLLLRQCTALRGHLEKEGNLYQLLTNWSDDCAVIMSQIED